MSSSANSDSHPVLCPHQLTAKSTLFCDPINSQRNPPCSVTPSANTSLPLHPSFHTRSPLLSLVSSFASFGSSSSLFQSTVEYIEKAKEGQRRKDKYRCISKRMSTIVETESSTLVLFITVSEKIPTSRYKACARMYACIGMHVYQRRLFSELALRYRLICIQRL